MGATRAPEQFIALLRKRPRLALAAGGTALAAIVTGGILAFGVQSARDLGEATPSSPIPQSSASEAPTATPIPTEADVASFTLSPRPSPAASPSETPAARPSPTAMPPPSSTPLPDELERPDTPSTLGAFGYEDILRVEVDGLAVRIAPFSHMPLATGWEDGTRNIGEVRLSAGDYVSVDLGPLQIGETTWYRVWPAENAQLHYSTLWWDTKNDGANPVEPGWVAAAVGDDAYLSLHAHTAREPWLDGLPLLLSGTGDYESDAFEGFDLYSIDWAYVIDEQLAPCDLTASIANIDGSESMVVVDSSTIGAYQEGADGIGAGDRAPVVGTDFVSLVLRISSGCEWTLRLEALPHD